MGVLKGQLEHATISGHVKRLVRDGFRVVQLVVDGGVMCVGGATGFWGMCGGGTD